MSAALPLRHLLELIRQRQRAHTQPTDRHQLAQPRPQRNHIQSLPPPTPAANQLDKSVLSAQRHWRSVCAANASRATHVHTAVHVTNDGQSRRGHPIKSLERPLAADTGEWRPGGGHDSTDAADRGCLRGGDGKAAPTCRQTPGDHDARRGGPRAADRAPLAHAHARPHRARLHRQAAARHDQPGH